MDVEASGWLLFKLPDTENCVAMSSAPVRNSRMGTLVFCAGFDLRWRNNGFEGHCKRFKLFRVGEEGG